MISFARGIGRVVLVLLIAGSMPSRANIGEDIDQLRHRYGSAKDMGSQMLFQHDGYSICVYFDGSHSAMEVFVRDGSVPAKTDITPQDIDQLLETESEGQSWAAMQAANGRQVWVRQDHHLIAKLTTGDKSDDKFLTIMVNDK